MANPEPFSEEARFSGSANPRPAKTTELWDENDVSTLELLSQGFLNHEN